MDGLSSFMAGFTPLPGRTLVVGSKQYKGKADRRALYPHAVGVDLFEGEGVDFTHDLEHPLPDELGSFSHIDCCSVLEHVQRPWLMCANIERVMAPRGTILICAPFVWRVHNYPGDYWRITAEALPILFPRITWQKIGYLAGGDLQKKTPALTHDGQTYLQKTEVVAFGALRHPDHP
jgi:2-polyprenyl-3-methyl-5-hydroxy-6-metoxy-1,4-benzoquinol methylase